MTPKDECDFLRVASLEELNDKGVIVVSGLQRPVAVFAADGTALAIDNRCPHMGFPMHRGTVKDGLITCHWHQARFDLKSGGAFDLFADDAISYDTKIIDGVVYVATTPRTRASRDYHMSRLLRGLEHNIPLIQAKSLIGLRQMGIEWFDIVHVISEFAAKHRDTWSEGMSLAAIFSNLLPYLSDETAYYALARVARQISLDCRQSVPRRDRKPLHDVVHSNDRLSQWFRQWVQSRHRDGAERVLLTAINSIGSNDGIREFVCAAASERIYADSGHVFDFANKSFELLDTIGWDQSDVILPLLSQQLVMSRGAEEDAHWHHPIELVHVIREIEDELRLVPTMPSVERDGWCTSIEVDAFVDILLGDDALLILSTIRSALIDAGLPLSTIAKLLCYAGARRLSQFSPTNEVADWFNPQHVFIYLNAVHQVAKKSSSWVIARSVLHGAIALYMDRFLNIPSTALPNESRMLPNAPTPDNVRSHILDALGHRDEDDVGACIVLSYIRSGYPLQPLIDAIAFGIVREDLDFHAIQVLEAAVRQSEEWKDRKDVLEHMFVAVIRQLVPFCPTPRASHQISNIAQRLSSGGNMYACEHSVC